MKDWITILLIVAILVGIYLLLSKKRVYLQEPTIVASSTCPNTLNLTVNLDNLSSGILIGTDMYSGTNDVYCLFDNSTTTVNCSSLSNAGTIYGAWLDNSSPPNVHALESVGVPSCFSGLTVDSSGITFTGTIPPYAGSTALNVINPPQTGDGYIIGVDLSGNSYPQSLNVSSFNMNLCNGEPCQYYYATYQNPNDVSTNVLTDVFDNSDAQCYNNLTINGSSSTSGTCASNGLCFSNPAPC